MSQSDNSLEPKWYVVHTYSGYENKVKTDLEKTIKNRELEDFFFNIVVPMEEQVEFKESFPWICFSKNDCNRRILVYR